MDKNGKLAAVVEQTRYGGDVSSLTRYTKNGKSVKSINEGIFNPVLNIVQDSKTGEVFDLNKSCGSTRGGLAGFNEKDNDIREFIETIVDDGGYMDMDMDTDKIKEYILKKVKV